MLDAEYNYLSVPDEGYSRNTLHSLKLTPAIFITIQWPKEKGQKDRQ